MTVHCPYCSTGYRLPDQLLGERGARVHCPSCGGSFLLLRDGEGSARVELPPGFMPRARAAVVETASHAGTTPRAGPDRAPAAVLPARTAEEPGQVAAELLDSLATRRGGTFQEARARGRLLAEFGPDLMRAYEEYRHRLGESGAPEPFRDAVRERWGVDLSPAAHQPGP